MSDVLRKNLEFLKEFQPNLYSKINSYVEGKYTPREGTLERIMVARDGELVINVLVVKEQKEFLLCDHENPIGEAYAWIERYIDPMNKAEIVFGIGFGYHLEVLLTTFPKKKVVIIEPNIELFYQMLKIRNMELIIKKAELFVDETADVLLKRIYALYWDTDEGGIQLEPLEVYVSMFYALWEEIWSKFLKQAQNFQVDIATRRYFAEQWIYNNIMNAEKICNASDAGKLKGRFKGVPGFLVSAGPSLAKNMHLIKGLRDKGIIMAAGTAARLLFEKDIKPHFMVGIDSQEAEGEIHKSIKTNDVYFLYSNQVAPESIEGYKGPKFIMNYPVDIYTMQFFRYAGIGSEIFLSGPSVANTSFDLLYKMGCNPIIILGQDMAYTFGSLYAGDDNDSVVGHYANPQEEGFIKAKDIHGNEVYTTNGFMSIKNWYEGYFEKICDRVEIINASEGGLGIQFARNEKLSKVIEEYDFQTINIEEKIKEIYNESRFSETISTELEKYKEYVCGEIKKMEEYSNRQLKSIELISRDVYHPGKDKKAFDKIVDRINQLSDDVLSMPIFSSLLANLVSIEFFLIKMEVDRAIKENIDYNQAKEIFVNAILRQNSILKEKLNIVKDYLAASGLNNGQN